MAVILELSVPAGEFELGRLLRTETGTTIRLETMVPMGEAKVPFLRVDDGSPAAFESAVQDHDAITDIYVVNADEDGTLFALDWEPSTDPFFDGIDRATGHVLEAVGSDEVWQFEVRFPSHESVSTFQTHCDDHDVPIDVARVYNPTKPDAGPWFGLTGPQREMLVRAVEAGYYSIPRRISTRELAAEFDISDQAVTERLRRAIIALTSNTLLVAAHED